MRGVEYIDATRLEESAGQLEVRVDVIRVEMFEELVTEEDVGRRIRNGQLVSVIDDEFEVWGRRVVLCALIGNIDSNHAFYLVGDGGRKTAVARGKLEEDGVRLEEWAK